MRSVSAWLALGARAQTATVAAMKRRWRQPIRRPYPSGRELPSPFLPRLPTGAGHSRAAERARNSRQDAGLALALAGHRLAHRASLLHVRFVGLGRALCILQQGL